MSVLQFIRHVFDPRYDLAWGVDGDRVLLCARNGTGARVLARGAVAKRMAELFRSPVIHVDLGTTPVTFVSEELDGEGDDWLDANRDRVRPVGLSEEDSVTEWAVHENRAFAVSLKKDSLERVCQEARFANAVIASLSAPLWNLGRLYADQVGKPFILVQTGSAGTLFGFVYEGRLVKLLTHWASEQELPGVPPEEIAALCTALADNKTDRIITAPSREQNVLPEKIPGYTVTPAPTLEGVDPSDHAAYAAASREPTRLDFTPLDDSDAARMIGEQRKRVLKWGRTALILVGGVFALLGLAAGSLFAVEHSVRRKAAPIRRDIAEFEKEKSRLEELTTRFSGKARLLGRESAVGHVLTELQEAFPEGMWAERISVVERDSRSWDLEVIALSYSTAGIPSLIKNLEQIQGISDTRMIYSEQTQLGKRRRGKTVMRVKVGGRFELYMEGVAPGAEKETTEHTESTERECGLVYLRIVSSGCCGSVFPLRFGAYEGRWAFGCRGLGGRAR